MDKIERCYIGDGTYLSFDGKDIELSIDNEADCVSEIVLTNRVMHHMCVMLAQAGFDFSIYVKKVDEKK